jgi:uncharacterized iron-regulated protein
MLAHKPLYAAKALLTALVLVPACQPKLASHPSPPPPSIAQGEAIVTRYINPATGANMAESELRARLGTATHVLLGELHDNPYHHLAQAELLRLSLGTGARAVFMEMLEPQQEGKAQTYLASAYTGGALAPDAIAAGFGAAVEWQKGWPPFTEYQPILDAVTLNRLQVYAANLPKAEVKAIALGTRDVSLPAMSQAQSVALLSEIAEGHCGMLPEEHLAPMAKAQRARDLAMAEAMLRAARPTALIAGRGHTRKDRGVPFVLQSLRPGVHSFSIAMVEEGQAQNLADLSAQFDAIGVTKAPSTPRKDPCAVFHR